MYASRGNLLRMVILSAIRATGLILVLLLGPIPDRVVTPTVHPNP